MINTDFSLRAVVNTLSLPWQESPAPLVRRRCLERDGGESARATSIVEYEAGATFPAHRHDFGEEILENRNVQRVAGAFGGGAFEVGELEFHHEPADDAVGVLGG